jgi:DNA-binding CsgD family transcriptional regulator
MTQLILPILPEGASEITNILSVVKKDGNWYYFAGLQPVFSHDEKDQESFNMFTSQLIASGLCQSVDIIRAFGISKNKVKRNLKKYKSGGAKVFYQNRKVRGKTILTEPIIKEVQELLSEGKSRQEISKKLGIKYDTIRKAIAAGHLHEPKKAMVKETGTTKSERTIDDARAGEWIGVACSRTVERVLASIGKLGQVQTRFEHCLDVTMGGVLSALPVLEACGLYRYLNILPQLPSGYYSNIHIITVLALMFLCRIKALEQLRFQPSGEMGKLLGLDRIPEVKTIREKNTHAG